MIYPWQGAIRRLKRICAAKGLLVVGFQHSRWRSELFSGLRVTLLIEPSDATFAAVIDALQGEDFTINGYLLADVCEGPIITDRECQRQSVDFLLLDDEVQTFEG